MVFNVETASRTVLVKVTYATDRVNRISRLFSGNIAFSRDGNYIIVNSYGIMRNDFATQDDNPLNRYTRVTFLDAKTGDEVKEIRNVHVMEITASALSHDGRFVVTGTSTTRKGSGQNSVSKQWFTIDNTDPIRIWDSASGKNIMELGPIRGAVRKFAFSPNDKVLISCQTDYFEKETIWLWDLTTGQLIERVSTPKSGGEFHSCALSPDGRIIAIPVMDKIYLINIKQ